MRDRLTELLEAECGFSRYMTDDERRAKLADHLLANGVIVPPCKVGQMVYMPWKWKGQEGIACLTVCKIIVGMIRDYVRTDFETDDDNYHSAYGYGEFDFDDFGKTVFLTREDAEKALAERKK